MYIKRKVAWAQQQPAYSGVGIDYLSDEIFIRGQNSQLGLWPLPTYNKTSLGAKKDWNYMLNGVKWIPYTVSVLDCTVLQTVEQAYQTKQFWMMCLFKIIWYDISHLSFYTTCSYPIEEGGIRATVS